MIEDIQYQAKQKHDAQKIQALKERLDRLLHLKIQRDEKDIDTLQKAMQKHQEKLTQCLDKQKVPPDNNASERAIRNIKLKEKISTHFRSRKDARIFTVIRSVIDTAIKQGVNPFDVFAKPDLLFTLPE